MELRARGLQANLAAWYPWKNGLEVALRIDSCAIIVIGLAVGVRKMYDPSVLCEGIPTSKLPSNWSNMETLVRDDDGNESGRRPWEVPVFNYMGQGYPLQSYRPQVVERRKQLVHWSFAAAVQQDDPAVAGIITCTRQDKGMFPFSVEIDIGSRSWQWPPLPLLKQKPVDVHMFDPQKRMSGRGAHMPLMVFMGMPSETRRTPAANQRRAQNAARRGWTQERIRQYQNKGKNKGRANTKTSSQPAVAEPSLQLSGRHQQRMAMTAETTALGIPMPTHGGPAVAVNGLAVARVGILRGNSGGITVVGVGDELGVGF